MRTWKNAKKVKNINWEDKMNLWNGYKKYCFGFIKLFEIWNQVKRPPRAELGRPA